MGDFDRVARIQAEWERERPDLDVSAQGVIGRLHRLAAVLSEQLAVVYRQHGLTEGDFDVLATLRRAGSPFERTAGELAEWTMVTSGGMTKRLDRLVQEGLVTRRISQADARSRVVALTERGLTVIDAAVSDHMANERRLLEMLPAADRQQLRRILHDWLEHFE